MLKRRRNSEKARGRLLTRLKKVFAFFMPCINELEMRAARWITTQHWQVPVSVLMQGFTSRFRSPKHQHRKDSPLFTSFLSFQLDDRSIKKKRAWVVECTINLAFMDVPVSSDFCDIANL
ncbi:uncharacterized protein V6R79_001920 [Siganus canaliculatus]